MANELVPVVGQWYRQQGSGDTFRVVAIDAESASIEIQAFDGDIEEIEREVWEEMELATVEAPEDWTGPYDELPVEDREYSPVDRVLRDWQLRVEREVPQGAWRDALALEEIE